MNKFAGAAVAVVLVAGLVGCGDDDESSDEPVENTQSTGVVATTEETPAPEVTESPAADGTTVAPTAASEVAAPPDGEPIRLGWFNLEGSTTGPSLPGLTVTAQAAVDYINEELGGVNGRPLEMVTCNTLATPESTIACANELVDESVDVIVKGTDPNAGPAIAIFEASGLAYAASGGSSTEEVNGDNVFLFTPGASGIYGPVAAYAAEQGWEKVSVLYLNTPGISQSLDAYGKPAFENLAVEMLAQPFEVGTADLTPLVATAASENSDAFMVAGIAAHCISGLSAKDALALDAPMFMSSSCDTVQVYESEPAAVDGAFVVATNSLSDAEDPDTKLYLDKLAMYAPAGTDPGGFNSDGFNAIMNLYRVLSDIEDPAAIDSAAILDALKAATDVPLFMGGGGTFTCNGEAFPGASAVCSSTVILSQYKDMKLNFVESFDIADSLTK